MLHIGSEYISNFHELRKIGEEYTRMCGRVHEQISGRLDDQMGVFRQKILRKLID